MTHPYDDKMTAAMPAQIANTPAGAFIAADLARPKFNIRIEAQDGTLLVELAEDARGFLTVTGDESRWDEGAKRFLYAMMQWSGLAGIGWKEEIKRAAGR